MQNISSFHLLLEEIAKAEIKGESNKVFKLVRSFWSGFESDIKTQDLTLLQSAEIHLIVGTLMSRIGDSEQVPNAQELARDELSKAERFFVESEEPDNASLAASQTGSSFCRSNDYGAGRIHLEYALTLSESAQTRAHILNNLGGLEFRENNFIEALDWYKQILELELPETTELEKLTSDYHKANAHHGLAIVYEAFARFYPKPKQDEFAARAVTEFEKSIDLYQKVGNKKYEASTRKNLGSFFYSIGNYESSIELLESAKTQQYWLRDYFSLASSYFHLTKTYLALGDIKEAVICGANAVRHIGDGDNKGMFALYAKTYAAALVRAGREAESKIFFLKALEAAMASQNAKLAAEVELFYLLDFFDIFSNSERRRIYNSSVSLLAGSQEREIIDALKAVSEKFNDQLEEIPDDFDTINLEAERIRVFKKPIEKALKKSGGNITKAAQMLSLTRGQLRYELKNYPDLAFKNASGRKSNIIKMPQPSLRKIRSGIDFSPIKKGDFVIYAVGKWNVGNLILLANKNNVPMMGRLLLENGFYYLKPETGDNIRLNESDLNYILGQVVSYQNSSDQIIKI